jgi:hypothetical protein
LHSFPEIQLESASILPNALALFVFLRRISSIFFIRHFEDVHKFHVFRKHRKLTILTKALRCYMGKN